jgi:hypothetical protein
MNFQNANLATFDRTKSLCPLPDNFGGGDLKDKVGTTLALVQTLLEGYFKKIVGGNNPYILGYSIESKQGNRQQPTLAPTSATFSTYFNRTNPKLSTLNFLVMTYGDKLPDSPGAGLYTKNLVTASDADGRFIITHQALFGKWLFKKIKDSIGIERKMNRFKRPEEAPGWNDVVNRTTTDLSGNHPPNYGSFTKIDTGSGWKFKYEVCYKWHEQPTTRDIPPEKKNRHCDWIHWDVRELSLKLENPSLQAAGINIDGNKTVYFDRYEGLLNDIDCRQSAKFGGTVTFSAGEQGKLSTNVSLPAPKYERKTSGSFGFFQSDVDGVVHNVIGSQSIDLIGPDITSLFSGLAAPFVMPAGDVFFFKNAQFDEAGNLLLDVTYKMNS